MTMPAPRAAPSLRPDMTWAQVNQRYLDWQLRRLRLLLQRRMTWLRQQWRAAPAADPLGGLSSLIISDAEADRLLAEDIREQEAAFQRTDAEARALTETLARIEKQTASLREIDPPPALVMLAELFALAPFEEDVLLLCLAPEMDAAFGRLYAYVQDDPARAYATPQLAWDLFGGGEELAARRQALLPQAPLRWFQLIEAPPQEDAVGLAALPLRLAPRVRDFLMGVAAMDPEVMDLLRPLPDLPLTSSQRAQVQRLIPRLEAHDEAWPLINLVGPADAGQEAVAAAIARAWGLEPMRLDAAAWIDSPRRQQLAQRLAREAILARLAFFLEPDPAQAAALRPLTQRSPTLLFLASRRPWPDDIDRERITLALTRPSPAQQTRLWQALLGRERIQLDGQLDRLAQQFDFGPMNMARAAAQAAQAARLDPSPGQGLQPDSLWRACREVARRPLADLAQRIDPAFEWDDIVLPDDTRAQLRELASQAAHRHVVYERWGFGRLLTRGRGVSALFAGPSGTGKTMAAEILANHLQLDLYRVDLAGVVSKYIGETEKNLRRIFDAAERGGAILFFDEADALFGKRTEVKDSHDRYANIEVNYLLQRMETYRGLAILATNRKSALDQAFLRRLRFVVDFPFPVFEDRVRIWRRIFPPQTPVADLDYEALARLEITGGNIRNIAVNAAFLAATEQTPVTMRHIMHAARREYQKINKLFAPADFEPYLSWSPSPSTA